MDSNINPTYQMDTMCDQYVTFYLFDLNALHDMSSHNG